MAFVWLFLFLFTSPAMAALKATSKPSEVLYKILKDYNTQAAKEAFIRSGRKVYNLGLFLHLQTFDEVSGKATVNVIHRRVWRDTTVFLDATLPLNLSFIQMPTPWLWIPEDFIPTKEKYNCNQIIRKPNWVQTYCTSLAEVECLKSKDFKYPNDRFTCRMRSLLSNAVRKQNIQCVNNSRNFWGRGEFSPHIVYPPLPCRNMMSDYVFDALHVNYPHDWKMVGVLERMVSKRLVVEFTLERFHPHYYKSDALLGAIAGIVAISISLFGLSPSQRLEISSIGLLIVLAHFQVTTEIPVVESGHDTSLVSLSVALICIQCISLVWSIAVSNFELVCANLGGPPPFFRSLFDRFISHKTEEEGEDKQIEKQWKAAIFVMDHILFAILACGLLVVFPITLL